MALNDLQKQFPIVDVPAGTPTTYFMTLVADHKTLIIGAVQDTRQVIAGAGLTGGGDLSADRTFDVGAGTGIIVNANDVAIDLTAEAERIRDTMGTALVAGTGVTITPNDGADTITIASTGSGFIPLVDGAEPPAFITDGAGALILVAHG